MLRPSTLPSTDRLRFLPSDLYSVHSEYPNPQSFHKSSLLPITITRRHHLRLFCRRTSSSDAVAGASQPEAKFEEIAVDGVEKEHTNVGIGSPSLFRPLVTCRMSLGDQAFFLLTFIACTTSIAFTSLVIAAVPTLFALKRAATSLARLADTTREELPSTMAAIRLSGMEISDLTLELNELSEEIADGVNKSAQAVQAAEAGIRQIGALARQRTISMIQERANLPEISFRPLVAGAARKTSDAVGRAKKKFINFLSRGEQDDEERNSNEAEY
ncbi:uncharacterized protein LOC110092515 [Dendrobium catenatum]|uniref:Uncharacterized protein n=1 Tax=Dendrobium catenatum TaxID=906689 RepID=A0A2I0XJ60_9ASPA|nr:uncharacterized protein LOC110092515 [Dendrobium catenatum]PKU87956.1 hypothetical protein MA16_Dca007898 [Dendrobium catenatum]